MSNVKPFYSNIFYLNNDILPNWQSHLSLYKLSFSLIFYLFLLMKKINRHYNHIESINILDIYLNNLKLLQSKSFLSISSNNIFSNSLFTLNNQIGMFFAINLLFLKQNAFLCFLMHKNIIKLFKEFIVINRNKIVDAFWIKNIKNIGDINTFQRHIDGVLIKLENDFDSRYFEELTSTEKEFLLMSLCLHYFK